MLAAAITATATALNTPTVLEGGILHYVPDHPPQAPWGVISLAGVNPWDTSNTYVAALDLTVFGPLLRTVSKTTTEQFYDIVHNVMAAIRPLDPASGVEAIRFEEVRDIRLITAGDDTRWAATMTVSVILSITQ